jgi:hypothetical protein
MAKRHPPRPPDCPPLFWPLTGQFISAPPTRIFFAVLSNGTLKWSRNLDNSTIDSSPALAPDGTIYIGGQAGLYAYTPDGVRKWVFPFSVSGGGSPTVAPDGTVFIGHNGFDAINPDGTSRWHTNISSWLGPAIGPDGTIYLAADKLYAFNTNGTLKWSYAGSFGGWADAPVVGGDGIVYARGLYSSFFALNTNGTLMWSFENDSFNTMLPFALGSNGVLYLPKHQEPAVAAIKGKVETYFRTATCSVSGTVFNDLNTNGIKDTGEAGLSARTVYVDANTNGWFDHQFSYSGREMSVTTDASGNYQLNLIAGTYMIRTVTPSGWGGTFPASGAYVITVTEGQNLTNQSFGSLQTASISGNIFSDLNANGVWEGGEPGLSNWRVYLDANTNGVWDTGEINVLSSSGYFSFSSLLPGTYIVRQVDQAGWRRTTPSSGSYVVTVSAGQSSGGKNFGNFQDTTPPTVLSINRLNPTTQATSSNSVTWRVTFSEHVNNVSTSDFTPTDVGGTITGESILSVTASAGTNIDVTVSTGTAGNGDLRLDVIYPGATITDDAGNALTNSFTTGQLYTIDRVPPTVLSINRLNPAAQATTSNTVVWRVTFSEHVNNVSTADFIPTDVSGTITGESIVSVRASAGTNIDVTVSAGSAGSGDLRLDVIYPGVTIIDDVGNALTSSFTSGQIYTIDHVSPTVLSISRQNPSAQATSSNSVTWRVAFSEHVNSVSTADFMLTDVAGTITGESTLSVSATEGANVDVTASTGTVGNGDLRLDVIYPGATITDDAGNALTNSFTSGQLYTLARTPPAVAALTPAGLFSVGTNASGTLNGTANPNGLPTILWFEWGTTTNYGSATAPTNLLADFMILTVNTPLSNLTAGLAYHFRLAASNAAGLSVSGNQAFGPLLITPLGTNPWTNECHYTFCDPGVSIVDPLSPFSGDTNGAGTVNTNSLGSYLLTYTATNATGAAALATRTVLVRDTTPAVMVVLGPSNIAIPIGTAFLDPGVMASDACAGDLTASVITNGIVNTDVPGDYTLAYAVTDPSANTSITNRTVRVVGPPLLSNPTLAGNGHLQFSFGGSAGVNYTVLSSTNLFTPLDDWTTLGFATETSPGQFRFSDPLPPDSPEHYYRVKYP